MNIQQSNRYDYFITVAHFEMDLDEGFAVTPHVYLSTGVAVQISGDPGTRRAFLIHRSTIDPSSGKANWSPVCTDRGSYLIVKDGFSDVFRFDEPAGAWFCVSALPAHRICADGERLTGAFMVSISGGGA